GPHEAVIRVERHDPLVRQIGRLEHVAIRCLGKRFARVFVERRLGIKALDVARATNHEQPNDALCPRSKVRPAIGRSPGLGCQFLPQAVARQHRSERQAGKAHADITQKLPTTNGSAAMHGDYRIVTKSLWLNSTWTRFSRARKWGSVEAVTSDFLSLE